MPAISPPTRFSRLIRSLHWISAVLLVVVYATAELRGLVPRGTPARAAVMQWHMALGLLLWLLLLPRIGARLARPLPAIVPRPGQLATIAAKTLHVALYLFLIAQPLLGLITAQSGERAITLPLLNLNLPVLWAADPQLHEWTEDLHVILGKVFYAVIALHAAAALWHHFALRDNTLRRML